MRNLRRKYTEEELKLLFPEKTQKRDAIVEKVIDSYRQRSEVGIKKYNTTLEENNDSLYTFLVHLQEELQDATLYIEKLKSKVLELHNLDMKMTEK